LQNTVEKPALRYEYGKADTIQCFNVKES